MDAQLKRGILTICILQILRKQDTYGYDIVKIMQDHFPETEESTLYAILRRLYRDGMTSMYLCDQSQGPKRKYYRITKEGEDYFQEAVSSWKAVEETFRVLGIV